LDTKRGKSLPLYGREHGVSRVRVINSIDCRNPTRHKCIVMAKTDSEVLGVVIVEPDMKTMEKSAMLVARVFATDSSVCEIPIQITNPTNKALTLFKGQNLGFIDEEEDADAPI
jgi:hypothetical protein